MQRVLAHRVVGRVEHHRDASSARRAAGSRRRAAASAARRSPRGRCRESAPARAAPRRRGTATARRCCQPRIGTWNAIAAATTLDGEERRVPHQEIARLAAGEALALGGRDRGRVHHHQAERQQEERRPHDALVVLRGAPLAMRMRRLQLVHRGAEHLAAVPCSSRNMSKLAQAGESSTASPGCAAPRAPRHRLAQRGRALRSARRCRRARPRSAAHRARSARPTARARGDRLGERREVLPLAVAAGDQDHLAAARAEAARSRRARRPWRRRWCPSSRRRTRRRRCSATRSQPVRQALEVAQRRRAAARPGRRDARGRARARRARWPRCAGRRARSSATGERAAVAALARARLAATLSSPKSLVRPARASQPKVTARRPARACRCCARIVAVQHLHAVACEHARLRGRVVVHARRSGRGGPRSGSASRRRRRAGSSWSRAGSWRARAPRPRGMRPASTPRSSASSTGGRDVAGDVGSRARRRGTCAPVSAVTVVLPLVPVIASTAARCAASRVATVPARRARCRRPPARRARAPRCTDRLAAAARPG